MPVRVRELVRVNNCGVDVLGVRSGRERLNRLSTFEVGWIIGDKDQCETRSGKLDITSVVIVARDNFKVRIVHYSTAALEEVPEGLIGPNSVPKRGTLNRRSIFHLDSRRGSGRLPSLATSNRDGNAVDGSAAQIRDVVEQGEFGEHSILPDDIGRGTDIPFVGNQTDDARCARLPEGLCKDQGSIVHRSDSLPVVLRLGSWGRNEGGGGLRRNWPFESRSLWPTTRHRTNR